ELTSDLSVRPLPTTHQMRHTYATTLLNAGMPLMGLKELLGHKSLTMTLRYAAITQETVKTEYFSAIEKINARYRPMVVEFAEADETHISDEKQLQQVIRDIAFEGRKKVDQSTQFES
ncbi:MAG: tyrosine-type recombinase/integrase, partial [Nanoarchaeota archaeon]